MMAVDIFLGGRVCPAWRAPESDSSLADKAECVCGVWCVGVVCSTTIKCVGATLNLVTASCARAKVPPLAVPDNQNRVLHSGSRLLDLDCRCRGNDLVPVRTI